MQRELEKLKGMVGNSYTYKGKKYLIKGFVPESLKVRIYTDQEDIVILEDGLAHQLTYFVVQGVVKSEVQSSIGSLASVLRESIELLRKDAAYIPQAEAINATVKTMVEMAKAEIDYRRTELEYLKLEGK